MAETVQITLNANTTGAINAIRNFSATMAGATQGVQKLATGLSQLGSNAASITSALGKTATSETITKWTDLGTSIAFAGRALADISKGAAQLASKATPGGVLLSAAAALGAYAGVQWFKKAEAEKQQIETINNVIASNNKLVELITRGVELKRQAGALTAQGEKEVLDLAADAAGRNPTDALQDLSKIYNSLLGAAGNREALKAKLLFNEFQTGMGGDEEKQYQNLKERLEIIQELQRTYEKHKVGYGQTDVLTSPTANSTEQEVKDYKELVGIMRERAEIEEKINGLIVQENQFMTELAATAVGAVQTALAGVADGLTGLIMGTRTWAQAMQQTAASILNMVIQLILKFTVLYGLISILQAVFPGSGFVGKFAGFAGFPGKATGGLVGSGMYQVGEKGPEYVIDNKTLNRMGTGFFQSLQNGVVPSIASVPKGMAASGGGAAGSGSSMGVSLAVLGGPGAIQQWAQTREGRAYIVDIANETIRDARS